MHSINFLERRYIKRELPNILKKSNFMFVFIQNPFLWKLLSKTIKASPFSTCQICSEVVSLQWSIIWIFEALVQKGVRVIPKIKTWNLCKPFQNMIIPFSTSSLNLKRLDKKEENCNSFLRTKNTNSIKNEFNNSGGQGFKSYMDILRIAEVVSHKAVFNRRFFWIVQTWCDA